MQFEEFIKLSKNFNLIPVSLKFAVDFQTPAKIYNYLRSLSENSFLLESVDNQENPARYSFIGINPECIVIGNKNRVTLKTDNNTQFVDKDIFSFLKDLLNKYKIPEISGLPYFTGGYIGYISFEAFEMIEESVDLSNLDLMNIPDVILGKFNTLIVYDHLKTELQVIENCSVDSLDIGILTEKYNRAINKLNKLKKLILSNENIRTKKFSYDKEIKYFRNDDELIELIEKGKKHIFDGDVYQIVLSNKIHTGYSGDLFNVYRTLRNINPSAYMYHMVLENLTIIGTSPEDLLKVRNNKISMLPIAGTIKRGKTEDEDYLLQEQLLNDKKELSEHIMLVDLARNDIGKVSKLNSVSVTEDKTIKKYSHLMHIVSKVEGELDNKYNSIDALKSAFPAGTVSGAPKIKAIELIGKLEQTKRNIYAGAIGYISFNGNIDMCIAIRTFFANNENIFWQSGAGIVYDSIPQNEINEFKTKSAVLFEALKLAEELSENITN